MPKTTHAKRLKDALDKFDPKFAEKALDLLADDEDNGHDATKEEENLRARLIKCLDAYQRTLAMLD
jgi:hypothetical protein